MGMIETLRENPKGSTGYKAAGLLAEIREAIRLRQKKCEQNRGYYSDKLNVAREMKSLLEWLDLRLEGK